MCIHAISCLCDMHILPYDCSTDAMGAHQTVACGEQDTVQTCGWVGVVRVQSAVKGFAALPSTSRCLRHWRVHHITRKTVKLPHYCLGIQLLLCCTTVHLTQALTSEWVTSKDNSYTQQIAMHVRACSGT